MASSISKILKIPSDLIKQSITSTITNAFSTTGTIACNRRNLFARISPLGDPELSVVPVLDQWVQEGMEVKGFELRSIIRSLRSYKRFRQALEVSEWMRNKGRCPVSPGDHAVQLDLIGRVRGLDSAENYFNNLTSHEKVDKLYGALLSCYVREGLVDKSLSHMQIMKEMGLATSPLSYNGIMCLYTRCGQLEKIPGVLSEMKENGVSPDKFSYRLCMNSYGLRSDLKKMEEVLKEMESQPHMYMEWTTYSMVANFYIKEDIPDKALNYLLKCEDKVTKDALGYNHLISHYARLGNKAEIVRLWGLQKSKCKKHFNRDYITMLGSLVKVGDLEKAEDLVKEWELSGRTYDFRVPNILLIGYCQKGLVEKSEKKLRDIVEKGKIPIPNSWAIVASGYVEKGNMEKAFECMMEGLVVEAQNKRWRPKEGLIRTIISWLSESGKNNELQEFLRLLKNVPSLDSEMKNRLVKITSTERVENDNAEEYGNVDMIQNEQ